MAASLTQAAGHGRWLVPVVVEASPPTRGAEREQFFEHLLDRGRGDIQDRVAGRSLGVRVQTQDEIPLRDLRQRGRETVGVADHLGGRAHARVLGSLHEPWRRRGRAAGGEGLWEGGVH